MFHDRSKPPVVRLFKNTVRSGECLEYVRQRNKAGYGLFTMNGRKWLAHRAAYTLVCGPIPEGLTIDHLCRNRACIEPTHLEPVTFKENIRRKPVQTHCANGHEFDEANTYMWRGTRRCRKCNAISVAALKKRRQS